VVQLQGDGTGSFGVDIAVGASGSEKVIASNLLVHINSGAIFGSYAFPVQIPAGSRIASRCQSHTASDGSGAIVQVILFDGAFSQIEGSAGLDAIGFDAVNTQGTQIDPGTTVNTKGAYTQLIASTPRDYMGFIINTDQGNQSTGGTSSNGLLDIAIGASGSEVPIVTNIMVARRSSGLLQSPLSMPHLPIAIPAGTRIAARTSSSINTATYRITGVTLYGVYQ
jgi:hypothetical protein